MVPRPVLASFRPSRLSFVAAVLVLAAAVAGCSSARPELPRSPQERHVMRQQGAAMIDSLVVAHGGMEAWNAVREMTFRGTDEWTGLWAKVLNPWPVERAAGENRFRVHDGLGRIAIVTDDGTLTYGIGRTGPWALLRGEPSPKPQDEMTARYVVAWHSFLAGVPFRFKESGAVAHYLGRAHRKYRNSLQEFDEVLVTYPPEGEVWPDDWFIVRMDVNTHEMKTLTYVTSARSQRLLETTCEFGDYVTVDGLRIPTTRTCFISSPIEASLHTWKMADLRFNQISPDDMFERRGASVTAGAALDSAAAVAGALVDSAKSVAGEALDSLGAKASQAAGAVKDAAKSVAPAGK